MPDLALLAWGVLAAFAAGFVFWFVAGPWGKPQPWRQGLGWVLGLGVGMYVGCLVLGLSPRWPPTEDRDRYLLVLLPLALAIEAGAVVVPPRHRWTTWLLRVVLAIVAAPILLFNSVYLADLAGPGSAEWSRVEAIAVLGTLAAMFVGAWLLLARLEARTSEQTLMPVLVLTLLAASFTVMLSGYYNGGLLGLPMSAAIAGAALPSFAASCRSNVRLTEPETPRSSPFLGIGLLGLFTVLVVGRLFGALPTSSALLLWFAPLLAWIAEAPGVRELKPTSRAAIRLGAISIVLIIVVGLAQARFSKAWRSTHRATGGTNSSFP